MATEFSREHVDNESTIDRRSQIRRRKNLDFAVIALLLLLLVLFEWIFKFYFSSPISQPNTTPATHSESMFRQPEPYKSTAQTAIAVIQPIGNAGASGTLNLVDIGDEIEIRGVIEGLTPGEHGFHIHEFGDLSDVETGKSAGGHFNPTNQPHGRRDAKQRHVGDLGNIEADKNGKANVSIRDSAIQLDGPNSIIGRSIVIHAGADQFTQPARDAGACVAFGVIGIAASD